ncbi:hypothetical protein ACI7BZ_12180 [Xanthobacter sp. AM11]|uniref:hypothetical protein n=1 Tax=Xanthobacter sp. AM11 TaxID=3380643 RepID=UPI0039BF72EA
MAGFGLGLGAFAQGFAGGIGLGQKWQDAQRKSDDRAAVEKINTDTKSAFEADKAAGKVAPDIDYASYWTKNAGPLMVQNALSTGDAERAAFYQKYIDTDHAKTVATNFGTALGAVRSGDMDASMGAFDNYMKNTPFKGYVYGGVQKVDGKDGKPTWQASFRGADGRSYTQSFSSPTDVQNVLINYAYPEKSAELAMQRDQDLWKVQHGLAGRETWSTVPAADAKSIGLDGVPLQRSSSGKVEVVGGNNALSQPKFGLNPLYGTDEAGNPVVLQPGTNGQMVKSQMPQGVTISQKPIQLDAGTHFVLLDPITRQPINTIPKDVAGAARDKAVGTAAGQAQAQLPGVEGMAAQVTKHIDDLANDPKLPDMVGPLASRLPNVTSDAARVQARMDQLQGGVFLQGYQMLKGGGAITEVEGLKAENAMARLNAAQNLKDYKQALGEFKDALTTGLAKLRAQGAMVPASPSGSGNGPAAPTATSQAGAAQPPVQKPGSIAPGTVVKGFVYRGGNPKDPNSWGRQQ